MRCGYCGKPAQGFATIDGVRYCHEADGDTCYMRASWALGVNDGLVPLTDEQRAAARAAIEQEQA